MTRALDEAELRALCAIALEAASEAAELLKEGYRSGVRATEKARADLVTEYDLASERLIRARLTERAPEIAFIGEESSANVPQSAQPTWYCDPIDGTTNFVHGHPCFCVSLGLYAGGQALLGAVVAPALSVRWHGVVGQGAFRNGVPCQVSRTAELRDALVATGFHPMARTGGAVDNLEAFRAVLPHVRDLRRCGSAALDLVFVADGTYDAYWERDLHAWDTIGGAAIALAAGARITSLQGGAVDLRIGHLLASNGLVHEALLSRLLQTGGTARG